MGWTRAIEGHGLDADTSVAFLWNFPDAAGKLPVCCVGVARMIRRLLRRTLRRMLRGNCAVIARLAVLFFDKGSPQWSTQHLTSGLSNSCHRLLTTILKNIEHANHITTNARSRIAAQDGSGIHTATKRRFSILFTLTAHRQRKNAESKRTGRIRGQPEIKFVSELALHRKQS